MDAVTLKDLMDPKRQDLQARYTNAQFAVDLGYRLAKEVFYPESKLVPNPKFVEGTLTDQAQQIWVDPTPEEKIASYLACARALKVEIEKDLNDTLKVLEVKEDGAKTDATKLS